MAAAPRLHVEQTVSSAATVMRPRRLSHRWEMYHAYEQGYSVLPRLRKLGSGPVFELTAHDLHRYLAAKQEAVRCQTCLLEHEMTPELYDVVCDFVVGRYPGPLRKPHTFANVAMQIQEDLIVHRLDEDRDWMAAGHISFPSHWLPESKIGRSLAEIHAPIPGMNLSKQRELVEAMVYSGPFERFVWTVVFEDRIGGHPRLPRKRFDPAHPVVYAKVERQVTVGFPDQRAGLFVLRQFLIPEHELNQPALLAALCGMSPAELAYKGLNECIDDLLAYLSK